jgi:hypothetical protein
MVKKLIVLCLLVGCIHTPEVKQKEWNDRYDPSEWRKQFEKCKAIHYTTYPEEIILEEWDNCMQEKDYFGKE